MPYYMRKGGTHRRQEPGRGMVIYRSGEIMYAEEWEIKPFAHLFEMVGDAAGRKAMRERGFDPDEIEGRVSTPAAKPEREETELPPPVEKVVVVDVAEQPDIGLELRAKGGGWYDVINRATGQALNDTSLRQADAELLIAGVRGGEAGDEAKKEATATTEADPVEGAEDMAGENGVHIRRGTEPADSGESTTED